MTKKFFSFLLVAFMCMGTIGANHASAADTFPAGCSSAIGYSVTTGLACNGNQSAPYATFLPGCTTALGYSITTGVPCSGSSQALHWLAGCSSTYGYSTITGQPCNGTTSASLQPTMPPVTNPGTVANPGLPMTGAGGEAPYNTIALVVSGILATAGMIYLVRRARAV